MPASTRPPRPFEEMGDSGGLGWTMGLLAWVRYQQGRLDEAEVLAADVARTPGSGASAGPRR